MELKKVIFGENSEIFIVVNVNSMLMRCDGYDLARISGVFSDIFNDHAWSGVLYIPKYFFGENPNILKAEHMENLPMALRTM